MKGFTLIELVLVMIIIAILASVALPVFRAKFDAAKWTEGRATMGAIATSLRVYVTAVDGDYVPTPTLVELGTAPELLGGTYFEGGDSGTGNFSWVITNSNPIEYVITAKAPEGIRSPSEVRLNDRGEWTIIP